MTSIPVARPWLGDEEAEAVKRVLSTGWVTQGPEVATFELDFKEYVGALHACAVSSGTTALHLALLVAGVKPGDEVITASHSFIATANAIRYCGATPVFVDVDKFGNLDSALVKNAVSEKTRAILVVHQLGVPADMKAVVAIGKENQIPVIEDAACAIGSEISWNGKWERIGKPHGDIACFSFHPRKLLTTGDGGMITTANAEWDARLRRLRQQGMDASDLFRHGSQRVVFERYSEVGFNYRMTDIQAAVGRVQVRRLSDLLSYRWAQAARYQNAFQGTSMQIPAEPEWARWNWQSYVLGLPKGANQRHWMQTLLDQGISTRRGVMCIHREHAYQGQYRIGGSQDLRESERIQDTTILLPLYHDLTDVEQDRVISAVLRCAGSGKAP